MLLIFCSFFLLLGWFAAGQWPFLPGLLSNDNPRMNEKGAISVRFELLENCC
jgi:hypothetical protein